MTESKNDDEKSLTYYLQHIGDKKIMAKLRWEKPELYKLVQRINYRNSFRSREPLHRCPKCSSNIVQDEWGMEYCPECGLVTRNNYPYSAEKKHDLPYGLKIY